MNHHEDTFEASDGIKLFYQSRLPGKTAKAILILVHGGGDHSGRYNNVYNYLIPQQFGIYALDWRGHGRSPGIRGHINQWSELRNDLHLFVKLVHRNHPDIPMFLFGHSMGGVMVLDYCLHKPEHILGIVCTSPAIGKLGISPLLIQIAKLLNKVWPSMSTSTGLDVSKLSHDQKFIQYTKTDPLYHRKATPRFGMEVQKIVDFIQSNAGAIKLPMLLIHGTDDQIVSIEGSRQFVKNANKQHLVYKEYSNGYHELFNDTMKNEVLCDIAEWINKQSA